MNEFADFITGYQLMRRWNMDIGQLLHFILLSKLRIFSPINFGETKNAIDIFGLSCSKEELLNVLQDAPYCILEHVVYLPDVIEVENKNNLIPIQTDISGDSEVYFAHTDVGSRSKIIQNEIERLDSNLKNNENVFCRFDTAWLVKFDGKFGLFADMQKYRYLAHLFKLYSEKPASDNLTFEVPTVELSAWVAEKILPNKIPEDILSFFKDLDSEVKSSKDLIRSASEPDDLPSEYEIDDLLENVKMLLDDYHGSPTNENLQIFRRYCNLLSNDYGLYVAIKNNKVLGFKLYHRLGKGAEKLRSNVKNQINNARLDIEKRIPKLSSHIYNWIKVSKSGKVRYKPESEINWFVSI